MMYNLYVLFDSHNSTPGSADCALGGPYCRRLSHSPDRSHQLLRRCWWSLGHCQYYLIIERDKSSFCGNRIIIISHHRRHCFGVPSGITIEVARIRLDGTHCFGFFLVELADYEITDFESLASWATIGDERFFLKGPQPCIQLSSSMFEDVLPPASLAFLVSPLECSTGLFRENLLR